MSILTLMYINAIGNLAVVLFMMVYRKNHLNRINTMHLFSQTMFALAFSTFSLSYMETPLATILTLIGNLSMISGSLGILLTIFVFTETYNSPKFRSVMSFGAIAGAFTVLWTFVPDTSIYRIAVVTFSVAVAMFLSGLSLYKNTQSTALQRLISLSFFFVSAAHFYRGLEIFDFSSIYVIEIPSLGNSLIMFSMFIYLIVSGSGIVMMFKESSDYDLYQLATYDHLTGTLNRNIFVDQAQTAILSAQSETYIGLVMVDIDRFKQINDEYGHHSGDELLQKFASILLKEINPNELIGRYGGDEFIMLLLGETPDMLYAKCERLRIAVQSASKDRIRITGSFGAAIRLNPSITDFDELSRIADEALYHSKSAGKNQVSIRYL